MRARQIALSAVALASLAAGCGEDGGGGLIEEDALRDCLSEQGLTIEAADLSSSAALGNVSPDFQAISEQGEIADLIVQGTEEKASRSAADIRGALQSFGASQSVVVVNRNAIAVFESAPAAEFRDGVETCID